MNSYMMDVALDNLSVWNRDVVPVLLGADGRYYVSARDIWNSMGVRTKFTTWFRRNRDTCMLNPGVDYFPIGMARTSFPKMGNRDHPLGSVPAGDDESGQDAGSRRMDFLLTLESAKEIALIQRTERAHIVRRKLIELEHRVREERRAAETAGKGWLVRSGGPSGSDEWDRDGASAASAGFAALPAAPAELLKKAGDLLDAMERMDARMGAIAGDVAFGRAVADAPDLISATQIAKEYGLSAIAFNLLLAELKVQYKKSGQWLLYARYEGKGYTRTVYTTIVHHTGKKSIVLTTKWTPRGRRFLYDFLAGRGMVPGGILTERLRLADQPGMEGSEYEDA